MKFLDVPHRGEKSELNSPKKFVMFLKPRPSIQFISNWCLHKNPFNLGLLFLNFCSPLLLIVLLLVN